MEISFNAMVGVYHPETIRITGTCDGHPVMVLVDGSSTHNFMKAATAQKLCLPLTPVHQLNVYVGNRECIGCAPKCSAVPLHMLGYGFRLETFILDIKGADVVLGEQWLMQLDDVMMNYMHLTMEFKVGEIIIKLQGERLFQPEAVGNRVLNKMVLADVQLLLDEYQEVFKEPEQLPPQRKIEHQIHLLPETNPVNVRPYRYPHFQKEEIEKLVEEMMQAGMIRKSYSAFSSLVLLERKKDNELYGAAYFSKIDLRSGYHQIRVRDEDIHKTAFRTHLGHYEFVVMPFDLTNVPSTFQATMNKVFKSHIRKFIAVFFDDILIHSKAKEEHLVTSELLLVDTFKIKAIVEWPRPTTLKQLWGFLGLTEYYRRFVASYAHVAAPLTELLKCNNFHWDQATDGSFESLKLVLTQTPVLALPNFSLPFTIEIDVSSQGIGAVLSQQGHPIAYFSKKLNSRLRVASAYVQELYAITQAVAKWCHYLLGRRFFIKTDHQGLQELMNKVTSHATDALLRHDEDVDVTSFQAFSTLQSSLLPSLLHATIEDQETQLLISQFKEGTLPLDFHFQEGLLVYKGRVWVPDFDGLQSQLLKEFHNTPMVGHTGELKMFKPWSSAFFWLGLRRDIHKFIQECTICQSTKYSTSKLQGLLHPLPVPMGPWIELSMNFIVQLPKSSGYSAIMVVVDRFSEMAHFEALRTGFTASSVAKIFIALVVKLHGFPSIIVSDRDPLFLSRFWCSLFKFSGTQLHYSTGYHPQSDGQTEVTNRSLEQYLRVFTHSQPQLWASFLP
ncbi:Transposon Ty3-I Gag-Pol polyprotein [Arachis hypogaea]|nr:Transposon Ty3-I Gag-Pol polyprotein [Arachis hypogaea]